MTLNLIVINVIMLCKFCQEKLDNFQILCFKTQYIVLIKFEIQYLVFNIYLSLKCM
nr:MAG TPA: hypothetical protein [Caudoviricetes sp.]